MQCRGLVADLLLWFLVDFWCRVYAVSWFGRWFTVMVSCRFLMPSLCSVVVWWLITYVCMSLSRPNYHAFSSSGACLAALSPNWNPARGVSSTWLLSWKTRMTQTVMMPDPLIGRFARVRHLLGWEVFHKIVSECCTFAWNTGKYYNLSKLLLTLRFLHYFLRVKQVCIEIGK